MNAILPTSEVLNRAADLIEERGWKYGSGWNDTEGSPLCLEGGIQAAMGVSIGPGYRCPAYEAVASYIGGNYANGGLWIWNDRLPYFSENDDVFDPSRERRDAAPRRVVEVLRACAVIEASRERETAEAVA